MLAITVRADTNNAGYPYSSAKIRTHGKFSFTYGRVTTRMKMPKGAQGMWVAFWALPSPVRQDVYQCNAETTSGCGEYGPWPTSGEVSTCLRQALCKTRTIEQEIQFISISTNSETLCL
jgi:beta-glucanase (GH16 family)